jgi:hypothetical protein
MARIAPKPPTFEPGWTSDMEGEPDIGILPDGTLNVVEEGDDDLSGMMNDTALPEDE